MNREQQRQASQLAFAAGSEDLEVGRQDDCPLPVEELLCLQPDDERVQARLVSGLTAEVLRVRIDGRDWTLKKARERCLVANVDGQTSFLNEVQRRADIARLKSNPATADRMQAMVDTCYASYRRGIIVSPWIAGVTVADWDERRLRQFFAAGAELILAGLFEWDFCPGNILDDGHVRLFDFGYMYRFDPLTDFNSNGRETPLFHLAERFETRNFSAFLLRIELAQGVDAAVQALCAEKRIALETYERLVCELMARGVHQQVESWLRAIIEGWQQGLRYEPYGLYLAECWRSHRLDVMDDLHGHSCTPLTLQRIAWLEQALQQHGSDLRRLGAFFWDDALATPHQLAQTLAEARRQALAWQLGS